MACYVEVNPKGYVCSNLLGKDTLVSLKSCIFARNFASANYEVKKMDGATGESKVFREHRV